MRLKPTTSSFNSDEESSTITCSLEGVYTAVAAVDVEDTTSLSSVNSAEKKSVDERVNMETKSPETSLSSTASYKSSSLLPNLLHDGLHNESNQNRLLHSLDDGFINNNNANNHLHLSKSLNNSQDLKDSREEDCESGAFVIKSLGGSQLNDQQEVQRVNCPPDDEDTGTLIAKHEEERDDHHDLRSNEESRGMSSQDVSSLTIHESDCYSTHSSSSGSSSLLTTTAIDRFSSVDRSQHRINSQHHQHFQNHSRMNAITTHPTQSYSSLHVQGSPRSSPSSSSPPISISSLTSLTSNQTNRPFRAFKSSDEYLIAMKEDLAEWFNSMYSLDMNVDNFMTSLETGVLLCRHANNVIIKARELSEAGVEVHSCFLTAFNSTPIGLPNSKSTPLFPPTSSSSSTSKSTSFGASGKKLISNETTAVQTGSGQQKSPVTQQTTTNVRKTEPSVAKTSPVSNKKSASHTASSSLVTSSPSSSSRQQQRSSGALLFKRTPSTLSSSSMTTMSLSNESRRSSSVTRLPQRNTPERHSGRHSSRDQTKVTPNASSKSKIPSFASSAVPSIVSRSAANQSNLSRRRGSLQLNFEASSQESGQRSQRRDDDTKKGIKAVAQQLSLDLDDRSTRLTRRRGYDQMTSVSSFPSSLSSQSSLSASISTPKSTVHELKLKLQSASDVSSPIKRNQVSRSRDDDSQVVLSSLSSTSKPFFSRRGSVILSSDKTGYWIPFRKEAAAGTFLARDNVCNFITWCRSLGIRDCLLFESDDLVLGKNEKSFILCLLEVARKGSLVGMKIPLLIQMEQEIDQEIMNSDFMSMTSFEEEKMSQKDHLKDSHDSQYNSEDTDSDASTNCCFPQQQIVTNDLRSLHEHVVDLLNRCTCPSQYPMIKVADGKYRIGDTKTLIFVRILRNHVMVRVGGGWDTLEHYLDKHDPCRCYYTSTASSAGGGIAAFGGSFRRRSLVTAIPQV